MNRRLLMDMKSRLATWSKVGRKQLLPWLFLFPVVLGFIVFSWYPIILGLVVSFQEYHPLRAPKFVGMENFATLFSDPLFLTAWKNTAYFAVLALLFGFLIPVILAVLINEVRRKKAFFRAA